MTLEPHGLNRRDELLQSISLVFFRSGFYVVRHFRLSLLLRLVFFWHQSEARTAATVWNWSGKTLSPGALLAVLYFSSFHIYFSARLDFPSSPLSAPGSPRMANSRKDRCFFNLYPHTLHRFPLSNDCAK